MHPNGASCASLLVKNFHRGGAMMSNALFDPSRFSYGVVLIGMAFWIFIALVVLASLWYSFARNRETQKTIRLAIEKGMQLDPALIDKLVTRKSGKPEDYYIGGFVCIAVGIGLLILGYFTGRVEPKAFPPLAGVGILVGLIGISLTLVATLVSRREKANKTGDHRL
jgi:multisubunit Na+/H+ antiporter MnhB subunit